MWILPCDNLLATYILTRVTENLTRVTENLKLSKKVEKQFLWEVNLCLNINVTISNGRLMVDSLKW